MKEEEPVKRSCSDDVIFSFNEHMKMKHENGLIEYLFIQWEKISILS